MNIEEIAQKEISRRSINGYRLASKFPELKGLNFQSFLAKCPLDLDFITANEMYEALNS